MTWEQKAKLEEALVTAREIGRDLAALGERAYRVARAIQEFTSNTPAEEPPKGENHA